MSLIVPCLPESLRPVAAPSAADSWVAYTPARSGFPSMAAVTASARLGGVRARVAVLEHLGPGRDHRVPEAVRATADVRQAGLHVQHEVASRAAGLLEHLLRRQLPAAVVVRLHVGQLDRLAHGRVDGDHRPPGGHLAGHELDERIRVRRS